LKFRKKLLKTEKLWLKSLEIEKTVEKQKKFLKLVTPTSKIKKIVYLKK
jgi:hypothetical protein